MQRLPASLVARHQSIERALDHRSGDDQRLERVRGEGNHCVGQAPAPCRYEAGVGLALLITGAAQQRNSYVARCVPDLFVDREAARLRWLPEVRLIPQRDRWMV